MRNTPMRIVVFLCIRRRDHPKRRAVASAGGKLIEHKLRVPFHEAALFAGRVGHKELARQGDAAQNDEVPAVGEVPRPLKGHEHIARQQRVVDRVH